MHKIQLVPKKMRLVTSKNPSRRNCFQKCFYSSQYITRTISNRKRTSELIAQYMSSYHDYNLVRFEYLIHHPPSLISFQQFKIKKYIYIYIHIIHLQCSGNSISQEKAQTNANSNFRTKGTAYEIVRSPTLQNIHKKILNYIIY